MQQRFAPGRAEHPDVYFSPSYLDLDDSMARDVMLPQEEHRTLCVVSLVSGSWSDVACGCEKRRSGTGQVRGGGVFLYISMKSSCCAAMRHRTRRCTVTNDEWASTFSLCQSHGMVHAKKSLNRALRGGVKIIETRDRWSQDDYSSSILEGVCIISLLSSWGSVRSDQFSVK